MGLLVGDNVTRNGLAVVGETDGAEVLGVSVGT